MVEPATYSEALRGLVNREFLASQNYQQQQWRANRNGAHPAILEFERVLVKRLAKAGVPMFAHCVVRGQADQQRLFDEGKSKDSPADGMWPHRAFAVDIVHGVKAWNLTKKEWAVIGHYGKETAKSLGLKVDWGGDWRFYDPAHWQVTGWKLLITKDSTWLK